ncbi:hypothetical protein IAU60_006590 [Kwoniella sp. DSM 27419]
MDVDAPASQGVGRDHVQPLGTLPATTTAPSDAISHHAPSTEGLAVASDTTSDQSKKAMDGYWRTKGETGSTRPPDSVTAYESTYSTVAGPTTPVAAMPPTTTTNFDNGAGDTPVTADPSGSWSSISTKRRRAVTPPLLTNKSISLVFRMPPGTNSNPTTPANHTSQPPATDGGGASRASSPGGAGSASNGDSGASGSKKHRKERAAPIGRHTRARRSSPQGSAVSASPAPALAPEGALSIFAPPPPTDRLPQALQSALHRDTDVGTPAPSADSDAMRREAAAGFESRLRSRGSRRDGGERTGVSASGKDVRVGGTARTAAVAAAAAAQSAAASAAAAASASASASTTATGSKKKGKGKTEVDVPNQDFCSACRGIGRFLCCDGCPRSFHFMCLEPPLRIDELPDEETWYCKKCRAERSRRDAEPSPSPRDKELRPVQTVFRQLSKKVDEENPVQFKLPTDIRTYFVGTGTAARGEFVDLEEARTKYDRKGFQEERDPLRIRDGKSRLVKCYACGGSSLPRHSLITDPESTWRQIVSCDYCALHWHLDCLDPPLASMPNSGKKWMCPNHVEQAIPKRRTVRNGLQTVDIESLHQPNNGNIIVVPEPDPPHGPALEYEDMVINRKKYRVPEKIIRLDFWEKLMKNGGLAKKAPALAHEPTADEMEAANLVLSLLQPRAPPLVADTNGKANGHDLGDIKPLDEAQPSATSSARDSPVSTQEYKQPKIVLRMPPRVEDK